MPARALRVVDEIEQPSQPAAPRIMWETSSAAAALAADLGTVKRSDGTLQVTYRGRPLYHYVKDGGAKDAYGAGITEFAAAW